ncbi:MAG: Ger(x)C family spore germination protein, partial [Desulfitobacteriaceae bacterium]
MSENKMKKVRLKFLIFLLLLPSITIFITGCWNQRDLNKLAIVSAIGIDKDEDQGVKVTVQIVKPTVAKVGGAAKGGSEDKKA